MDQLTLSCDRALEYPKNLVHCTIYEHTLNAFFHQLSEQESRLFQIDNDVSLDFWEFDDQGKGTLALYRAYARTHVMNRSILAYMYT